MEWSQTENIYYYIGQFYHLSTQTREHFPKYPGGFTDANQRHQSM